MHLCSDVGLRRNLTLVDASWHGGSGQRANAENPLQRRTPLPQSVSISGWPSSHTITPHGLFYPPIDRLDLSTSEPIEPAAWPLARGVWICDGRDNTRVFVWGFPCAPWLKHNAGPCQNIQSLSAIKGRLVFLLNATIFDPSARRKSFGLRRFSYIIIV